MSSLYKLLIAGSVAGAGLLLYSGVTHQIEVNDTAMGDKLFVYKKNNGDYSVLKYVTKQVEMDLKEITPKGFTLAKLSGGSPSELEANIEHRPIFGGLFDRSQKEQIERFMMKHPSYNMVELDDLNAVSVKFPYHGSLSKGVMRWKKVYSQVFQRAAEKGDSRSGRYFLELYPYMTGGEKAVEVMMPYGENANLISFGNLSLMKN